MGENLATRSLGGVGGFYPWLLHNNGIDPATGFRMTLGDGTELPFWIDENGISLINAAGKKLALRFGGSTDGQVTLNRTVKAVLAATFSNSTTTGAEVPDFSLSLETDKTYLVSGVMVCTSTATTRGVQLRVTGPSASVSWMQLQTSWFDTNTLSTDNNRGQRTSSFGTWVNAVTAPEAGGNYLTMINGMIRTNGTTPASDVRMEMRSSASTFAAELKAGSYLKFEEL